ncbi:MAG: hypothetical protein QG604_611 [Candidatus Dependentiae bacterium]|nr:hypothetical protein [Candidatus Dependentiae bacterium]
MRTKNIVLLLLSLTIFTANVTVSAHAKSLWAELGFGAGNKNPFTRFGELRAQRNAAEIIAHSSTVNKKQRDEAAALVESTQKEISSLVIALAKVTGGLALTGAAVAGGVKAHSYYKAKKSEDAPVSKADRDPNAVVVDQSVLGVCTAVDQRSTLVGKPGEGFNRVLPGSTVVVDGERRSVAGPLEQEDARAQEAIRRMEKTGKRQGWSFRSSRSAASAPAEMQNTKKGKNLWERMFGTKAENEAKALQKIKTQQANLALQEAALMANDDASSATGSDISSTESASRLDSASLFRR